MAACQLGRAAGAAGTGSAAHREPILEAFVPVQILDDPLPLMVDQVVDILKIDVEQVIDVPKITHQDGIPQRACFAIRC